MTTPRHPSTYVASTATHPALNLSAPAKMTIPQTQLPQPLTTTPPQKSPEKPKNLSARRSPRVRSAGWLYFVLKTRLGWHALGHLNGFREAAQPIHAHDEDVVQAAVLQIGQAAEPEPNVDHHAVQEHDRPDRFQPPRLPDGRSKVRSAWARTRLPQPWTWKTSGHVKPTQPARLSSSKRSNTPTPNMRS
jgi:hypothetical protein